MRNMKVSMKLILSFLIVIVMAVVVGGLGIIGMSSINAADDALYNENLIAVEAMGEIRELIQRERVGLRNIVLDAGNAEKIAATEVTMASVEQSLIEAFAKYEATITDMSAESAYLNAKSLHEKDFRAMKDEIIAVSYQSFEAGYARLFADDVTQATNSMVEGFTVSGKNNSTWASEAVEANTRLFVTMTVAEVAVLAVAIAVALILAFYISRLIGKPTRLLSDLMETLVKTANFRLDEAETAKVDAFGVYKDETGVMAHSFSDMMKMILAKCETIESVAEGDLTVKVVQRSEFDTIGNAMGKMVDNLNNMFGDINSSSKQVSSGSVQIADGAQLLAQGATEQSATVEELSASVAQISTQTKENAGTANKTSELTENIKSNAEQGSLQMEQMMRAVAEINESSKSIGKVIKIIDDIAFQTNILALNAAVEAARAGQHGKGFAVVADEVRSLAAKSAEAAKNTNELIENSIQKAEQGASISAETSESLRQIVEGIIKCSELVAGIAKSSNEQSLAISQIGEAIDQVSQVVQQNSATAEQSAAASEEMSGQATLLQQLIAQFKLRDGDSGGPVTGKDARNAPVAPHISVPVASVPSGFALDGGGKY